MRWTGLCEMKHRCMSAARCLARTTMSWMCFLKFKSGSMVMPRSTMEEAMDMGVCEINRVWPAVVGPSVRV